MNWFKRVFGQKRAVAVKVAAVVLHQRAPRMTEQQVVQALAGQGQGGAVQAVNEIAERMVWSYVEAARAGDENAVQRLDAVMELQGIVEQYCARKAE